MGQQKKTRKEKTNANTNTKLKLDQLCLWSPSRSPSSSKSLIRRCVSPIYLHSFTYKTSWFHLFFFFLIYVQVGESHCNFIRLLQSCLLIITILIFVDSVKKKDCSFYCSCFLCFCFFFFLFSLSFKEREPSELKLGIPIAMATEKWIDFTHQYDPCFLQKFTLYETRSVIFFFFLELLLLPLT